MSSKTAAARLLLTAGEPAGIGPDLLIKISQIEHDYDVTVIGDPNLLLARAQQLSIPIDVVLVDKAQETAAAVKPSALKVIPIYLNAPVSVGIPDVANAQYVLDILSTACDECLINRFDAIVTTPVQKSIINEAGISFSGHTEYFATRCGDYSPVMLLASKDLNVALVTTHLPLQAVAEAITPTKVEQVLRIILQEFPKRFGISNPAITVCGLNPHAGENGNLGTEEQTVIRPIINKLIAEGSKITGPIAADTAFNLTQRQQTDVFVCMYHDQGLPVLKTLSFGSAVNITLGIPIIRTSVDHGTALALAGTGDVECNSLMAAIEMATMMINKTKNFHDGFK